MKENHRKLLNSVIRSIDWKSILKVHQSFNHGIGLGNFAIPGLKRKEPGSIITIKELKHELRSIIKYIIANDIPSIQYGYWHIFWTNEDWDYLYLDDYDEDYEDEDDEDARNDLNEYPEIEIKARLEVLYCPQRILLLDPSKIEEYKEIGGISNNIKQLKIDLDKAIEIEDYERAEEIRKAIESFPKSDK